MDTVFVRNSYKSMMPLADRLVKEKRRAQSAKGIAKIGDVREILTSSRKTMSVAARFLS